MTQVAIQIPDDLKPFLDRSVKAGLFSDASDFLVNLLYNLKAETEADLTDDQKAKLVALRSEIATGLDQAERGQFSEFTAEDIIHDARLRRAAAAR